jgi:hypothetical protein
LARASSKTISYDIQSAETGESRVIFERSYVKSTRAQGKYITAAKQYALFDNKGRRYRRESNNVVTCLENDARFHIVGHAEKIRKTA